MALTDIETVKKILQSAEVKNPDQFNNAVKLQLFEGSQLEFSNVTRESEIVKIIRVNVPQADSHNPITLNDQDEANLDAQRIVPESVVVASDAVLTIVYVENDDYIINYDTGTVARTSLGSTIPNGGTVHAWYIPFVVLARGNDYNMNYDEGSINRRAGSTIPNNAIVYVDYNHSEITASDTLITELIEQMEAMIGPKLKGGFTLDSADKGLKAASTNFIVYGVCLASSLKELRMGGKDNSDDLARRWHDLAEKYLTLARTMFGRYLAVSSLDIGGLIENRFTKTRKRTMTSPSVAAGTRRH